jgi:uncharacterized protein YjiS (DUF1127 family)
MTTATLPRQGFSALDPLPALARLVRVINLQLHRDRSRQRHRRYSAANHLDSLSDRLRQDIGLSDSSPTPAELLERFHRMHAAYPREHAIRLRPWIR